MTIAPSNAESRNVADATEHPNGHLVQLLRRLVDNPDVLLRLVVALDQTRSAVSQIDLLAWIAVVKGVEEVAHLGRLRHVHSWTRTGSLGNVQLTFVVGPLRKDAKGNEERKKI